jgi:hypothetical protein
VEKVIKNYILQYLQKFVIMFIFLGLSATQTRISDYVEITGLSFQLDTVDVGGVGIEPCPAGENYYFFFFFFLNSSVPFRHGVREGAELMHGL